jgi:hypothetical protein
MSNRFLLALLFVMFFLKDPLLAQDEMLYNSLVQAKKDTKIYTIQSLKEKR